MRRLQLSAVRSPMLRNSFILSPPTRVRAPQGFLSIQSQGHLAITALIDTGNAAHRTLQQQLYTTDMKEGQNYVGAHCTVSYIIYSRNRI